MHLGPARNQSGHDGSAPKSGRRVRPSVPAEGSRYSVIAATTIPLLFQGLAEPVVADEIVRPQSDRFPVFDPAAPAASPDSARAAAEKSDAGR